MTHYRNPRPEREAAFVCVNCRNTVITEAVGIGQRNHCPHCLCSVHLDVRPGDRRNACRGLMEPIGIWTKDSGEWSIIHRCARCGTMRSNSIAGDDGETALLVLALRPLASPAFPLDTLPGLTKRKDER